MFVLCAQHCVMGCIYSAGTLEADRQQRLQELPGWTWDAKGAQWEDGFQRLREYVERHGDARVRKSYTVDGYRLGGWINNQRTIYSRGTLEADRQRRLEELSGWVWDPYADAWEEGFSRLREYVERHGDARVPTSYKVDGYNLGRWVCKQRGSYLKGTFEADRQQRLQDLPGWAWDADAAKWEDGFQRLREYVERHGDARVRKSYTVDGYRLGGWINNQRTIYSRGTLEADRQQRLTDLSPDWKGAAGSGAAGGK